MPRGSRARRDVDYPEAERAFAWARSVCPHRLDGMEVYSTVLWHLKKEAVPSIHTPIHTTTSSHTAPSLARCGVIVHLRYQ